MSNRSGVLYIVATPIGNLDDITERAKHILGSVGLIAAEDTRHSGKLLKHLGIQTSMCSYHQHNEQSRALELIEKLQGGKDIAVISDAGTPLIHDPGFQLVTLAHQHQIPIVPVAGVCALTAALSVAGFNAERFIFEGFLPEKQQARIQSLQNLAQELRTTVYYEAPHRILACLGDMIEVFGGERQACVAREITKMYESIKSGTLTELLNWYMAHDDEKRGEFVVVVEGAQQAPQADPDDVRKLLGILLGSCSVKDAANLASQISGVQKNAVYKLALEIQNDRGGKK